jgi:hypothetical protein
MNFRNSFEDISLKKFFGWFLFATSFVIFFNYFILEDKFSAFNNYGQLFNSMWGFISPANISNTNKSLNMSIEKSSFDDRLNEYYEIHKRITKLNASHPDRRISFNKCGQAGYCNRLYSFLSTLVIAIYTNSQLVVQWPEIESYVDLPIQVFNKNFSLDEGMNKSEFQKRFVYTAPAQAWSRTKNIDALMKTSISESAQRYLYTEIGPYFMELCSNPKYFSKLSYYNLVQNETVKLALEAISNNKSSNIDKQERIFKIGFEVGGNLLNRMWRPKKSIMDDVRKFFEKYFRNNFVIGIQLRYHYLSHKDTEKFIKCALDIEQEYLFNRKPGSTKINSFKWFIASDSQGEIDGIIKNYPNKTFTTNEYALGHIVDNKQGFYRAMLDVELLSLCNEMVVTGASTFGWVAAMKSLTLPLFINGHGRSEHCLRSTFSDPPSGGQGPYASF